MNTTHLTLPVAGMTCAACTGRGRGARRSGAGSGGAGPCAGGGAAFTAALPAPVDTSLEGMTCASCVARGERVLAGAAPALPDHAAAARATARDAAIAALLTLPVFLWKWAAT